MGILIDVYHCVIVCEGYGEGSQFTNITQKQRPIKYSNVWLLDKHMIHM